VNPGALDADNASVAYDAVPNNDPVIEPDTLKLPVMITDPEANKDPVITNVSAFDDNSVVPEAPVKFVDPVTVKEPDMAISFVDTLLKALIILKTCSALIILLEAIPVVLIVPILIMV
jgi:hypothetical protein